MKGPLVLVVLVAAFLTCISLSQPRETRVLAATYVHGVLHVSIPYDAPQSGTGDLVLEILDPEDNVTARIHRHDWINSGEGLWKQDLTLSKALPLEDLVWHRLRYKFTYQNGKHSGINGITSISRIIRLPVVHVVAQQSYLSGGAAAIRLIATESDSQTPVTSGTVRIDLIGATQNNQTLYTGKLNERGTTQVHFQFPDGMVGRYRVHYAVDTPIGTASHDQDIELQDKSAILLTTEKPIYQPGQTIHFRALALDRANQRATGNRKLTFEVEDSRGNKVFRNITQTDDYGIASAEFALADEVNLGAYHLRAVMEDATHTPRNKAEIALTVERYVLPRFKVAVELTGKAAKVKRGYRPGDHVYGTVRANYFFGQPVGDAEIVVKVSGMDVARFDAGNSHGRTDTQGAFAFDLHLPEFLAGHTSAQGAVPMLIEAEVKDTSGHTETRGEPVLVSESPLLITVIPEGGTFVRSLENRVFVLTSYPDGTPAQADIRVQTTGAVQNAVTDGGGIAVVTLPRDETGALRVHAKDHEGNQTSVRVALQTRAGAEQVLLRTERAVYRAGDRMKLEVLSTKLSGAAYVDLIKNGQTIGTHDLDIAEGRAELNLVATPDMTGTLEINAYFLGKDARPVEDHRLLFVQPADELRIETTLDAPVYRPGGEARIGFHVTNGRGQGVQAAIGVEIVDQAVFALAEKQPGFAKVFFHLEQEIMKPRYEIHPISLPEAISSGETERSNMRDRAAQALFAATELVRPSGTATEFGRAVPQEKYREYAARYQALLHVEIEESAQVQSPNTCDQAVLATTLRKSNAVDAWGSGLVVENRIPGTNSFAVRSAGPDGQFNTADDLIEYRDDRRCTEPGLWGSGTINVRMEHGLRNAAPEITGIVKDSSGGVVGRASITLVETTTGKLHNSVSLEDGRFSMAGLEEGRFRMRVSSPGFTVVSRTLTLQQADRAVISVVLQVGSMANTVDISAVASVINMEAAMVAPRAAKMAMKSKDLAASATTPSQPETHVRSWFPEALFIAPEIITDRHGRASITVPIADNITTWRMSMLASTKQGALGSGTANVKVFQDFFTELDLPVVLTQGDQVSIPVAIYNYSGQSGQVHVRLEDEDWFSLPEGTAEKNLAVESGRVAAAQFTILAKRIGKFKLTLKAEMDGTAKRADIVIREIEVVPNGREQTLAFNGRVENEVEHVVTFPPNAIPDASKIFVRVYPGPLSQVVEGMDAILRMPYGCFEQTSSATYPNILALDYMKHAVKLTPEIHAKADGFIGTGYQRLLTFEVPGGGFSWFGQAPANKILTSYGLMEFAAMAKVHEVDPNVIQRTQRWLAGQQHSDGSWAPDSNFINEGATNHYNTDLLRITAYIAWALETTGYQGSEIDRAHQFIEKNAAGTRDAYTLAVVANFAADYKGDTSFTGQAMQRLLDARIEKDDQAWWTAEETAVYGHGPSAAIETTGLALQALLKTSREPAIARKALNYITSKKDASGTWGTTQATIMALQALLQAADKNGAEARGVVEITLNGKPVEQLTLTADNGDLFHQFVLKGIDFSGSNRVGITFHGEGSPGYQVAGRYFLPWRAEGSEEPISIDVHYDRTRLAEGQVATAVATVKNRMSKTANMVMVDLGIPPGFDILSEDLEDYRTKSAGRKSGRLEKFNLTATQAILYLDSINAGETISLRYRLRAKYPIRARSFESMAYQYYNPEVRSVARPVELEVRKR